MPEVISNTSPLQYLFQAGVLEILPAMYGRIIVPHAVIDEIERGRADGVALPNPHELPWLVRVAVEPSTIPRMSETLGLGERHAITLASQADSSLLLLDDRLARREASKLSVQITGTLGVLVRAKERGHLPRLRPLIDRLESLRFYLTQELRQQVLRFADEL